MSYYIGGYKYKVDKVNKFIFVSFQYSDFKIRITFKKKTTNNLEFTIYSRIYLLESEYRKKIMTNTIITYKSDSLEEYESYINDKKMK